MDPGWPRGHQGRDVFGLRKLECEIAKMWRHQARAVSTATLAIVCWLMLDLPSRSQDLATFVANTQPKVSGLIRVQSYGDEPLNDAEWAGHKSQARQLQGIVIKLDTPEALLRLEYQCNVEDVGNIGWFAQGSLCGIEYQKQPKRLEAVQIRLAGTASEYFTVRYECHVQGVGDVSAKADGQPCGTSGEARRLEAVRVWVERLP
jgi:hypothetical protein